MPLAPSAPLLSMLTLACSVAVFWRAASRRSGPASAGANFSVSARMPFRSRASRLTVMLPPGDACVWIRPVATKLGVAEIADRQPFDREAAGVELEARGDVARVEAGDLGAVDLDRQRDLARPLQAQAGQRGLAKADHAVEIEFGGAQLAVEPRRPVADRPGIGHAALDHAAVDLGAQPLDRDPVRPQRHVAAGVPRLELRRRGRRPASQATRFFGSLESMLAPPAKPSPLPSG